MGAFPQAEATGTAAQGSALVSVVIPSHNGWPLLAVCLQSLRASDYPALEILVVDNASTDGTAALVAEQFPEVRVLRLELNAGYAGGSNAGIRLARGELIFLLNNDTAVAHDAIATLVAFMEAHPDAGLVGPKVVGFDDPTRIDTIGLTAYPDGTTCNLARGMPADVVSEPIEIFCPSGCACLCRRAVFEEVGVFDDQFHLLMEDADLGWRVRRAGWSCYCVPSAVVRHRASATLGSYSALKAYYVERNRIWLAVKNFPPGILVAAPFYSLLRYGHQAASVVRGEGASSRFYQRHGARVLAWMVLKAHVAAVVGLPAMVRQRARGPISARRASAADFRRWIVRFGISARDLARSI